MSHLPRQEIRELIRGLPPLIENCPPIESEAFAKCLQPDSFDVRIGFVMAGGLQVVDEDHPEWELAPGGMAVIVTKEILNVPPTLAAEVGPRQSVLSEGLLVLSATHVDPGYRGPLSARVINLLDRPYPLKYEDMMLTITFYKLTNQTEIPYPTVSVHEKIETARKESRHTFKRPLLREEDVVLKGDLYRAAREQAIIWVAAVVIAGSVVLPFSAPFFWNLGRQLSSKYPELWIAALIVVGPLVVVYYLICLRVIVRLLSVGLVVKWIFNVAERVRKGP